MDFEGVGEAQDGITYRRVTAWELKRLSDELSELKDGQHSVRPLAQQWLLPAMFGILLTGAIGYIGIVHQLALRTASRIDTVAETQQRGEYMRSDVEELKKRMLQSESAVQQIPYLATQLRDINTKLDRIMERR